MERLIDNALIYGAMFPVDRPHLVARYNQALEGFGLKPVKLDSFVIDAVGYSPEVARALDDSQYLNPHGINQRFIILSPEQESLPVVHQNFSSTYDLMMAFYQKNAESLRTLTLKDVVFGEIENSTFRVNSIDDILSIREVEFKLRTGGNLFQRAGDLTHMLDRFLSDPDGWKDSELMHKMLGFAKTVGDVRYNNIIPRDTRFQLPSFWTSMFEGLYVFHEDDGGFTIIGEEETAKSLGDSSFDFDYFSHTDRDSIYDYLLATGRILPFEPEWLRRSGLMAMRADLLVREAMAKSDETLNLVDLRPSEIRNWIYHNLDSMADSSVFDFLTSMQKRLLNHTLPDLKNAAALLKLLVVRANPDHQDRVLVSRLLSTFAPFDFFTRFAVDKNAFYDDYEDYGTNLREFVVQKLTRDYFPNRAEFWRTLFAKPED